MSTLIIDCPSCSRKLRVPDELLGKAVKCPTCEHTFQSMTVQASTAPSSEPPPAPDTAHLPPAASDKPPGLDDNLRPCPNCGERNDKDAMLCRSCGQEFVDKEEDDERPWEDSRQFRGRRDAEPHRGPLILGLGIASIVMVLLCGPVGLPLGIVAWVMGRRDLIKMRQKLMDREGEGLTQAGWICGIIGTILDSLYLLACLVYVGFIFTLFTTVRRAPPAQMPAPVPGPVRPAPAPPPGPPGNKAAMHRQAYLPTAEG